MVSSSHCAVPTSYVTVLLSPSVVPLFFFLIFDGTILILCSTNITCDCTFVTFYSSLICLSHLMVLSSYCAIPTSHETALLSYLVIPLFFLTFDGTILTICSTNIIYNCIYVTFGGSLIFFLHLIMLFSYCVVLTSHITVLLSHLVNPFFFLTFDGIILILCSTNITCDCIFVTFGGSLIFSHI